MNKRGLTLVELMTATALACLLLTALLTVASASRRCETTMLDIGTTASRLRGVIDLLHWDLTHAQSLRNEADTLVLDGHMGLERDSLKPTHRPVRVTYHIQRHGGEHSSDAMALLIRQQRALDETTDNATWSEIVAINIDALTVDSANLPHSATLTLTHQTTGRAERIALSLR